MTASNSKEGKVCAESVEAEGSELGFETKKVKYSYFSTGKTCDPPPPRKISQAQESSASSQLGASCWNGAGTFEERTVTKWAIQCFCETLQKEIQGTRTGLRFGDVVEHHGEALINYVRGKCRRGFDFDKIKIKWEWQELQGTCILHEINSSDVDDATISDIEFDDAKEKQSPTHNDALRIVRESLAIIKRCTGILKEELEKLA